MLGSDYPGYQDYKLRVAHFRQERAYRLSWDNAQCSHEVAPLAQAESPEAEISEGDPNEEYPVSYDEARIAASIAAQQAEMDRMVDERFEGSDHTELYSGENTDSDVDEWDVRQGNYNSDESDMWDEVGAERVPLGNIYDITTNYGSD